MQSGDVSQDELAYVETKQHRDTFAQLALEDGLSIRMLSVRCQEAREENLPCQDYALAVVNKDRSTLAFCVCDGVGGSYKGDYAAYYLSNCLVEWLLTLPDLRVQTGDLARALEAKLHVWAEQGHEDLQQEPLPANISDLLRHVLDEQRNTYGSEAVFFAGRIDYGTPSYWEPQSRQGLFCWMGNIAAQVFVSPGKSTLLGDSGQHDSDRNRWSTKRGPLGMLGASTMNFEMVERLIISTDGLYAISSELASLDDSMLRARIKELSQLPVNDDMTLLDLQWHFMSPGA